MSHFRFNKLAKRLENMRIVFHDGPGDELEDLSVNIVLLKVLLELVIGIFENYLFFNKGASSLKAFIRSLVADQLLMLCQHQQEGILEISHVERDVIKEFHHTVDELE